MKCFTSYYKNIDQEVEKKNDNKKILPTNEVFNYEYVIDNYSREKNIFKIICLFLGFVLESYIYSIDPNKCYGIGLGFGFMSALLLF
jgi:hypothetical protein